MARPTVYDAHVSDEYVALMSKRSPFGWLSLVLEDKAISMLPASRNVAVLDLACGVGGFCGRAARLGFREVVGVDLSPSQVEAARRRFGADVCFEVADARTAHVLPGFAGRFDIVNASWPGVSAQSSPQRTSQTGSRSLREPS